MAVDRKEREALDRLFHNLYCTPYSVVEDGKEKGRLVWHRELRPELGDLEAEYPCRCKDLKLKYNGEVVRDGVSLREVDGG